MAAALALRPALRAAARHLAPLLRAPAAAARAASGYTVGANLQLPQAAIDDFHRDGYVVLRGFLSEAEIKPIEAVYDRVMRREIAIPGNDFCDMSKSYDTKFEDFSIINAMLPRRYHPALAGNVYERRSEAVAAQLYKLGAGSMTYDYDQFLDKRPRKADAVFAWHQDMAYVSAPPRWARGGRAVCPTARAAPRAGGTPRVRRPAWAAPRVHGAMHGRCPCDGRHLTCAGVRARSLVGVRLRAAGGATAMR